MTHFARTLFAVLLPAMLWAGSVDEDRALFVDEVYPVFERAQCRLCHDDNGIATATRVQFPPEDAGPARLLQFGYSLRVVVDAANPADSLLLAKPTQTVPHTGGQRIAPGSADAAAVGRWAEALASIPVEEAKSRIAQLGAGNESSSGSVRRLTHAQYNNTVRDLLGSETRPADDFPPEDYVDGFSNQVSAQAASPILTEAYNGAARKLARAAFLAGDSHGLIPCEPSGPADPVCRDRFLRQFGRRAFRRPLSEAELGSYGELFSAAARQEKTFTAGAQVVIEAMLQSPNFLFYGHEASRAHRIASRLAYFLWNTTPDDALLAFADNGQLNSPDAVEKVARTMLADPRAQDSVDDFLAQWMRFDRLLLSVRDSRIYPEFSVELAASMAEETRTFFRDIVWNGKDFNTFFSADYSFVDQGLAKVYGIEPPAQIFEQVSIPAATGRGGILGQASFLTVTSKPGESSPTERGKFIREQFLCQIMPPPPAGVSTQLPPVTDEAPLNNRQQLGIHLSNVSCAACHQLVDPIGFGLEHYDAIGKYRETQFVEIRPTVDELRTKRKTKSTEYHIPIDASAYIHGIEDSQFANPREAGELLAGDPVCRRCTVKQLFRYALGRHETEQDQTAIDQAFQQFEGSQFDFRELIIAIAVSEPFVGADQ